MEHTTFDYRTAKAAFNKSSYRSAEALRHPKSSAKLSFPQLTSTPVFPSDESSRFRGSRTHDRRAVMAVTVFCEIRIPIPERGK
jgi:hypothetical protein